MASSNSVLNRAQSAPVEHVVETTKLKACSSQKIPSPSSPTQSSSADSPLDDRLFHNDDDDDDDDKSTSSSNGSSPSNKSDHFSVSDNSVPIFQPAELLAMTEAPYEKLDDITVSDNFVPISQPWEIITEASTNKSDDCSVSDDMSVSDNSTQLSQLELLAMTETLANISDDISVSDNSTHISQPELLAMTEATSNKSNDITVSNDMSIPGNFDHISQPELLTMIEASDDISISHNSNHICQPELLTMTETPPNKSCDISFSDNSVLICQPPELLAMTEVPPNKSDDISVFHYSDPTGQPPELLATTETPPIKSSDISVSNNSVSISQPMELLATTEAPPTQEMERSPSSYRIPSSVFKRNKSSTPVEWSVASNESLFSIHNGNMSFTSENYFWRAEDSCPPAEASASDQMFSYPAPASAVGLADDTRNHELGLAEATMLEVIKENEVQSRGTSMSEARHPRHSEGSNTSFAFSIAGGDEASSIRIPSSVRSNQSQLPPTAQAEPLPEQKPPTETGNEAQSSWFSCFSCCGRNQ